MLTEAQVIARPWRIRERASGILRHPGYVCRQSEGSWARLPIDLHRHLCQGCLRQALRSKTPITAADLLNDRVIPFFESNDVKLLRILTDRDSEYRGNPERHEYELYLAVENIDHSRIKTKCVLSEFNRIAFSQKGVSFNRAADRSRWVDPRITSRGHIKGAGSAKRQCRHALMQGQ
jgi:hypothetical protein